MKISVSPCGCNVTYREDNIDMILNVVLCEKHYKLVQPELRHLWHIVVNAIDNEAQRKLTIKDLGFYEE